jgi:transposase InsO family protein
MTLVLNALLMAVWRRRPQHAVIIHSAQFSSHDWQDFLKANNLVGSMSRRGNCHDTQSLKVFFSYSSANVSNAESTTVATKPVAIYSITSSFSTTRSGDMVTTTTCLR